MPILMKGMLKKTVKISSYMWLIPMKIMYKILYIYFHVQLAVFLQNKF